MIPTVSDSVKQNLQTNAFNNGFLMTDQWTNFYAPKEEVEFMRLTREYYSLRYDEYDSATAYLIKIKTMEERIRDINMVLDRDKQTLLCLGTILSEHLHYLTKI